MSSLMYVPAWDWCFYQIKIRGVAGSKWGVEGGGVWPGVKMAALNRFLYKVSFHLEGGTSGQDFWLGATPPCLSLFGYVHDKNIGQNFKRLIYINCILGLYKYSLGSKCVHCKLTTVPDFILQIKTLNLETNLFRGHAKIICQSSFSVYSPTMLSC